MSTRLLHGDCRELLKSLPSESVHCCISSPPYFGLRDYGTAGQIGLEATPDAYVAELVAVFREVRRVLRNDGTLWLNLGDSYTGGGGYSPNSPSNLNGSIQSGQRGAIAGSIRPGNGLKPKDLIGIPWAIAFALRADGWWLRQDIIWSKPNPMPESVRDRCTKAHEYLFMFSKCARYYYDQTAIAEPETMKPQARLIPRLENPDVKGHSQPVHRRPEGSTGGGTRNKRSVWEVATAPFAEAHFATFPPALIEPCILAGCPRDGVVLDPFAGAGTTGLVADRLGRNAVLIELNAGYADMSKRRIVDDAPLFAEVVA